MGVEPTQERERETDNLEALRNIAFPREQNMLKGHLPRVTYHQVHWYTKNNGISAAAAGGAESSDGGRAYGSAQAYAGALSLSRSISVSL